MKVLDFCKAIQEDRQKMYGPFQKAIEDTAEVCTILLGKEITKEDIFMVYIVNKLVREKESHNPDNLVDGIVYLSGLAESYEDIR